MKCTINICLVNMHIHGLEGTQCNQLKKHLPCICFRMDLHSLSSTLVCLQRTFSEPVFVQRGSLRSTSNLCKFFNALRRTFLGPSCNMPWPEQHHSKLRKKKSPRH